MRIDQIMQQCFSDFLQDGFQLEKEKLGVYRTYHICKAPLRMEIKMDFREDTVDFKVKRGTTVLLLIEKEAVMLNAPFQALDQLMSAIHKEYAQLGNRGLTSAQLQRMMGSFVEFVHANWELIAPRDWEEK